jgi:hypothetical protein
MLPTQDSNASLWRRKNDGMKVEINREALEVMICDEGEMKRMKVAILGGEACQPLVL